MKEFDRVGMAARAFVLVASGILAVWAGERSGLIQWLLLLALGLALTLLTRIRSIPTSALVFVEGIGASLILTGYLANYYPSHARGAAVGWALSFARIGAICGPIVGGYIGSLNLPLALNFVVFAVAALAAGLLVMLIPPKYQAA